MYLEIIDFIIEIQNYDDFDLINHFQIDYYLDFQELEIFWL